MAQQSVFAPSGSKALTVNTTEAGTPASTTETDLWSYVLPANTLSVNGRTIRVTAFGSFAANVNAKTIKVYFGSTTVGNLQSSPNGAGWRVVMDVIRTGAATQIAQAFSVQRSTPWADATTAPTETLSGAVTIKVTGQNGTASANDIVFKGAIVEILN